MENEINGTKERRKIADMDSEIDISLDPSISLDEDILDKTLSASFTDELEPLMPIFEPGNLVNDASESDSDCRRSELQIRLSNALRKLQQSEQSINASWSLDNSVTNVKEEYDAMDDKFPRDVEDNVKSILFSTQEYIGKLEDQLGDLDIADEQIVKSTDRVTKEIDETYQNLINKVCLEINRRRDLMRLEAEVYKNESLGPLKACRQQVNAQIKSSRDLINELNRALSETKLKKSNECKIIEASSNLGRIPAVPLPEELPYVTFSPPSKSVLETTIKRISELGTILRMGPAQIVEIVEKPASLFVKWCIADPEYATEEQIFIVQKAIGEIHDVASEAFETVYEGSECSCFVRDIPIDVPVTLRVGLRTVETAWSVPRVTRTRISAYCWDPENKNYIITNDGKVAAKITDKISTLFSHGPQVDANQIIEFKFLEVSPEGKDNEGIALVSESTINDSNLRRYGALLITPHGKIFMDGDEKLMRLPRIRFGARIVFTILRKDDDTLRINIESGDKAVTYDWVVQTPLRFAARFTEHNKWNLMVK